MKPLNRYQLVREWWIPSMSLSAPLVLDRIDRCLRPYRGRLEDCGREWQQIDAARREHCELAMLRNRWQQQIADAKRVGERQRLADRLMRRTAGMEHLAALFSGRNDVWCLNLTDWDESSGISQTTLALDSAYSAGSAGDAISARLQTHSARTLNEVYYHITGFTGTAGNVNDLNIELRPEASAGAVTPDTSTLTDSATHDPSSTTGWHRVTGFTAVLSAASRYFVIVGDADGGGSDFATVSAMASSIYLTSTNKTNRFGSVRTTGGFASGNTVSSNQAQLVLVYADGAVIGNPLTASNAAANDTNRRGMRMTASALAAALDIFGITWSTASANISGMEIWAGDSGPSGTADHTSTDILYHSNAGASRMGCMVAGGSTYRLAASTAYSLVATYSGATAGSPRRHDIGTGEDANLRKAMPGNGEFYFRRADGTTDWSGDLVGSIPDMGVLVDAQVAASGVGGRVIGMGF